MTLSFEIKTYRYPPLPNKYISITYNKHQEKRAKKRLIFLFFIFVCFTNKNKQKNVNALIKAGKKRLKTYKNKTFEKHEKQIINKNIISVHLGINDENVISHFLFYYSILLNT